MQNIITAIISILSASGVLSIGAKAILSRLKNQESRQKAVELGVQALLRDHMIHNYNKYTELGYAPLFAKENFENMYQQYHGLGGNGVMTQLHSEFMELPTESEESK
ncbi:MAG: hypothetical protein NC320_01220 [Clostridium sp.]|nr:hypothetical protein [Clostridium sp.]